MVRGRLFTHTAHDMDAFAGGLGHDGPPTRWDEQDCLRRRAKLDAAFFHLYGLSQVDANYIMGTFPIVQAAEQQRWQLCCAMRK